MSPIIGTGAACTTRAGAIADFYRGYAAILNRAPEDRPTVREALPEIKEWVELRKAVTK